jgi:hypothetical protein
MVSSVNRAIAGPDAAAGGGAMLAASGDAAGDGPGPGGAAAGAPAARVPLRELMDDRLLDALLERSRDEAGGLRLTGEGSMLGELVKAVLERALEAELTAHLGYEHNDRAGRGGGHGNYRNGTIAKTVQTGVGPVPLAVPRDRAGTFEPLLVPKRAGRVAGGLDDMIISLYAHGMSVRDILHHLEQVYGTVLSAETVSRITDQVLEEVRAWQSRPLDPVYAVVFPAAIGAGSATTTPCRTSPPTSRSASTPTGRSTCWASGWPRPCPATAPPGKAPGSGARSRPTCATAAWDILIACCDGLPGFEDAITSAFERTVVQRCVVHYPDTVVMPIPGGPVLAGGGDRVRDIGIIERAAA